MKNLFIPYELAVLAKEKGFDEPCIGYYAQGLSTDYVYHETIHSNVWQNFRGTTQNGGDRLIDAPLYQQIIDWFREKHSLLLVADAYYSGFGYTINKERHKEIHTEYYYEALNKAIEQAFKLI